MRRKGCLLWLAIAVIYAALFVALAYGVYFLGSMAIEALIPDADAYELPARAETGTSVSVGEAAADFGELPPALPEPTIGEVDAEAEENRLIEAALLRRAHKIENCKITYYCCERYPHVCGTGDGLTALGTEVTPFYSCAVPDEIPLGATIMIDWSDGSEIEYRLADDRGGGVIGDHIDLAVPTHSEALEYGVSRATVYWVDEVCA